MFIAAELINENGISGIALAFFSALFGMVGTVTVAVFKLKQVTQTAARSAQAAQSNTTNVSNGFTARMDTKLDKLQELMTDHLEWHLHTEKDKHKDD